MESIEGKQQQFNNSVQEFTTSLMKSDFIKGAIDFGTQIVNIINDIIQGIGSINTLLGGGAIAGGIVSFIKNYDELKLKGQDVKNAGDMFNYTKSLANKGMSAPQVVAQYVDKGIVDLNDKKQAETFRKQLGKVYGNSVASDAISEYLGEATG